MGWSLIILLFVCAAPAVAQSNDAETSDDSEQTVVPSPVASEGTTSTKTSAVPKVVPPSIIKSEADLPAGVSYLKTNRRYGRLRNKRGQTYTRPPIPQPATEIIAIDGQPVAPTEVPVQTAQESKPPSRLARFFGFRQKTPTRTQEIVQKRIPGRSASRGYLPVPGEPEKATVAGRRVFRMASLPQDEEDVSSDEDDGDGIEPNEGDEANEDGGPLDSEPFRQGGLSAISPTLDYAFADIDTEDLPKEVDFSEGIYHPRHMQPMVVNWRASNLHHYPLYFEDPQLERYGHTYHPLLQPFASTARFAVQLAGMPYQMSMDPPWKRRYTLGWYRPGECAPYLRHRFPFNNKASLIQAATVAGLFFVIP